MITKVDESVIHYISYLLSDSFLPNPSAFHHTAEAGQIGDKLWSTLSMAPEIGLFLL